LRSSSLRLTCDPADCPACEVYVVTVPTPVDEQNRPDLRAVEAATRTDPKRPPLEFRRPAAAWQVAMDDGTNFYVDVGSGEIVARRTSWWRFYDWMWGLHIMDLKTREDAHNPLTIGFAIAALAMALLALVLLPMTTRWKRRKVKRPG